MGRGGYWVPLSRKWRGVGVEIKGYGGGHDNGWLYSSGRFDPEPRHCRGVPLAVAIQLGRSVLPGQVRMEITCYGVTAHVHLR